MCRLLKVKQLWHASQNTKPKFLCNVRVFAAIHENGRKIIVLIYDFCPLRSKIDSTYHPTINDVMKAKKRRKVTFLFSFRSIMNIEYQRKILFKYSQYGNKFELFIIRYFSFAKFHC